MLIFFHCVCVLNRFNCHCCFFEYGGWGGPAEQLDSSSQQGPVVFLEMAMLHFVSLLTLGGGAMVTP